MPFFFFYNVTIQNTQMNSAVKEETSASSSPQELLYDVLENGIKMETFEFDDSVEDEFPPRLEEFLPPVSRRDSLIKTFTFKMRLGEHRLRARQMFKSLDSLV